MTEATDCMFRRRGPAIARKVVGNRDKIPGRV
jgi:hypothetical protein